MGGNKISNSPKIAARFLQYLINEKTIVPLIGTILFLSTIYLHYFQPVVFVRLIAEDHWGEWITFLGFLSASVFCGWLFLVHDSKLGKLWFFILTLGSFFIAMEEISWGQRLFVFSTPQYFVGNNFQGEMTFHNIDGFWPSENKWNNMKFFGTVFLFYGFILPLATKLSIKIKLFFERIFLPIPSLAISPFFIAVCIFFNFNPLIKSDELGEMFMGFAIGSFSLECWLSYYKNREMKLIKKCMNKTFMILLFIIGLLTICCGFFVTPPFIAEIISEDGTLEEYTIRLIQGHREILIFLGAIFALFSIGIFHKIRKSDDRKFKSQQNLKIYKGVWLSIFSLALIILGFKLTLNYGDKIQFKNRLNDSASEYYYRRGLYVQAKKIFTHIEKHPDLSTEQTNFNRGRNLKAMQENRKAMEILEEELQIVIKKSTIQPDDQAILVDMALIHRLMENKETADSLFHQALNIGYIKLDKNTDPQVQRSIRMSLGEIYFKMRNYKNAISEFEQALKLSQNTLDFRVVRIRILHCQYEMNQIK